jgi:hypothetical protein
VHFGEPALALTCHPEGAAGEGEQNGHHHRSKDRFHDVAPGMASTTVKKSHIRQLLSKFVHPGNQGNFRK